MKYAGTHHLQKMTLVQEHNDDYCVAKISDDHDTDCPLQSRGIKIEGWSFAVSTFGTYCEELVRPQIEISKIITIVGR
jgi:hypothetical protein